MHVAALDGALIELKDGEPDPAEAVTQALGQIEAKLAEKITAIETKSAERLDRLEARLSRPGLSAPKADDAPAGDIERKAFEDFLRTGRADNGAIETKTLTLGSASGSVLAPKDVSTDIIQKLVEFSPVRGIATVISMGGALLELPRLVDEVEPGQVTETGPRPEDEPSFDSIEVKPFESAVIVPVSKTLLEDSAINLSAFLSGHLAKKFGQREARQFVNGNGTTEAEGVLKSDMVQVFDTNAAALKGDDLIDLFYAVASFYSGRGTWLMNRQTMAVVRKLKNGQGDYIWQPALAAGQPPSIMGRPVLEAPDMPLPAAGTTPIVFGDFATGYLVADRVGLEVKTDELTGWNTGIVKVLARRRVGGRVVEGDALVKLKLKAA